MLEVETRGHSKVKVTALVHPTLKTLTTLSAWQALNEYWKDSRVGNL